MSYKKPIFATGATYIVKQDFASEPGSNLKAGETLIFKRDYYSPYDDSFVYSFQELKSNDTRDLWLSDGAPVESWKQYFELAG